MPDETFYKRLLDNQRTALLLLDGMLLIRHLNAAAEALLYIGSQKLIATSLATYFCDSDATEQVFLGCRRNGNSITCHEAELRDASGRVQMVDYSVTSLDEANGESTLLVEIQPVNQLLRLSREEGQQQAHRATRRLVRGVAHELKNPLGGIKGAAQLLIGALPGQEWREYLDVIVDESDRLSELADRLLGVGASLSTKPVNIHECLERVRQLAQAEHPELSIVRDYDPSLPELVADRNKLIQALLNLVRNAIQSLLENHVEDAHVILRTRALEQCTINGTRHRLVLRVDVEDNGPGVPDSLREALFFPLVTGRAQGAGLGLAIAQDIVSQHQGQIDCDSRPGYTCFSLMLPVATRQSSGHAGRYAARRRIA